MSKRKKILCLSVVGLAALLFWTWLLQSQFTPSSSVPAEKTYSGHPQHRSPVSLPSSILAPLQTQDIFRHERRTVAVLKDSALLRHLADPLASPPVDRNGAPLAAESAPREQEPLADPLASPPVDRNGAPLAAESAPREQEPLADPLASPPVDRNGAPLAAESAPREQEPLADPSPTQVRLPPAPALPLEDPETSSWLAAHPVLAHPSRSPPKRRRGHIAQWIVSQKPSVGAEEASMAAQEESHRSHKGTHLTPASSNATNKVQFVLFRPRRAGMNNQLQDVVYAIAFARAIGRAVAMPPLAEAVTWDSPYKNVFPYNDYFDVERVARLVPVVLAGEAIRACSKSFVEVVPALGPTTPTNPALDGILGVSIERTILVNSSAALRAMDVAGDLPDCLSVSHQHGIIGDLLGNPPSYPKRRKAPANPRYRDDPMQHHLFNLFRSSVIPSPRNIEEGSKLVASITQGRPFAAIHLRLGDFGRFGCLKPRCPPMTATSDFLLTRVAAALSRSKRGKEIRDIYVAVAPAFMASSLRTIAAMVNATGLLRHIQWHGLTMSRTNEYFHERPDRISVVEQWISAAAEVFVGVSMSTWSRSVVVYRRMLQQPCISTFYWSNVDGVCTATEKASLRSLVQ